MSKLCVVAAGGTGGHLFPAQALAEELKSRGWRIVLATDERGARYAENFPAEDRIPLSAATYRSGDPVGMARAALRILKGTGQAKKAFRKLKPDVVVGFGGYPSLPGLRAALALKIPTIIHEQNSVLGRVNRYMAPKMTEIACAFPILMKAPPGQKERAHVIGNPIRPQILALHGGKFTVPGKPVRILVTGGSQGAKILSETVPAAIARLPEALRKRLLVQQQTREDLVDGAMATYAAAGVQAECAPFFPDMAERLGKANLIIGRAGASTVLETAVAGKPAIFVPLKIAMDDHQRFNASLLVEAGAARMILEDDLTAETLSQNLEEILSSPALMARMAKAASDAAITDAASKLADLVEATA